MKNGKTGYASIDKPQNTLHRISPIREINPRQTIYNLIFDSNKNNMLSPMVEFNNKKWTFSEIKVEVDRAANAFKNSGIKYEDTVLVGITNSQYVFIVLLALNKIGAVSKWFDVRAGEKDIELYANSSGCKCLICIENIVNSVSKIIDNTKLEQIITIDPYNRRKDISQMYVNDIRFIKFENFIDRYGSNDKLLCVEFNESKPSIMVQSSGTTGNPKTIVHSDLSFGACANNLSYSQLPFGVNKVILATMPPWIAYSLCDAVITASALGSMVLYSDSIDSNVVFNNMGKFSMSFACPYHYRFLKDNYSLISKIHGEEYIEPECFVSGGDKFSAEEGVAFEKCFGIPVLNGYGNNEMFGGVTVNYPKANKNGSVGIPFPNIIVISYDNDNNKELQYDEIGEICVLTESCFLGYEHNEEETNKIKQIHTDNNVWVHTGDLGSIDENGFVTLYGRMRRVIVRKAFKISAYIIEETICSHPSVKECVAVEVKDNEDEHAPMAFIVLKDTETDEEKNIIQSIYKKCKKELKEYEIPKHFKIIDFMPYTQNGKYDFRLLEKQGNEYVDELELINKSGAMSKKTN